jgi:hypothetical protein
MCLTKQLCSVELVVGELCMLNMLNSGMLWSEGR